MNKLTKEEFIERAKQIHGNKYDYSEVEYINNCTKVCIICPNHGEFWQTPSNHLSGKGCNKCKYVKIGDIRRNNLETFIEKAKLVHGDKYDYSKVEYKNAITKVCIICPEHGKFWQIPNSHLHGNGCPKCAKNGVKLTKEEFIERAKQIHGNKYDYSKVEYKNAITKVCIICNEKNDFEIEHGEFWQTPYNHLRGSGCLKCSKKIVTEEDFYLRSNKIHEDKYDYSKVIYKNSKTKVCIICPEHGEFYQLPEKHMLGQGCPKCKESKLEKNVKKILEKYNIKYIQEQKFDWLYYKQQLRLDFYLPDYNIAIECQGKQHFFENCTFSNNPKEDLSLIKLRDEIKYKKCKEHNIQIIYFTNEKINDSKLIKNETKLISEILKYQIA